MKSDSTVQCINKSYNNNWEEYLVHFNTFSILLILNPQILEKSN